MHFFKRIFAKSPNSSAAGSTDPELSEGDIFYTYSNNQFHIFKLLKIEGEDAFHVLSYEPQNTLPKLDETEMLEVYAYHFPVDKNGFEKPQLLLKSTVVS